MEGAQLRQQSEGTRRRTMEASGRGGNVFGVFAERICALLVRGSRCGFDDVQTGTVDQVHLRERRRPDSCLYPESEPSSRLSEREEAAQDTVAYVVELDACITGLYTGQDEP